MAAQDTITRVLDAAWDEEQEGDDNEEWNEEDEDSEGEENASEDEDESFEEEY